MQEQITQQYLEFIEGSRANWRECASLLDKENASLQTQIFELNKELKGLNEEMDEYCTENTNLEAKVNVLQESCREYEENNRGLTERIGQLSQIRGKLNHECDVLREKIRSNSIMKADIYSSLRSLSNWGLS